MRVLTTADLQGRILSVARRMDCENVANAKRGKMNKSMDDDVFELMFIHEFLPYWNNAQVRQKECYVGSFIQFYPV